MKIIKRRTRHKFALKQISPFFIMVSVSSLQACSSSGETTLRDLAPKITPTSEAERTFDYQELTASSDVDFFTVAATDINGDAVTYSIESQKRGYGGTGSDDVTLFTIDSATGVIKLADTSASLDYESSHGVDLTSLTKTQRDEANTYTLAVVARSTSSASGSSELLSSAVTYVIKVTDENDIITLADVPAVDSKLSVAPSDQTETIDIQIGRFFEAFVEFDVDAVNQISSITFTNIAVNNALGIRLSYMGTSDPNADNPVYTEISISDNQAIMIDNIQGGRGSGIIKASIDAMTEIQEIILAYKAVDATEEVGGASLTFDINNLPVITPPPDEDAGISGIQVNYNEATPISVAVFIVQAIDADAQHNAVLSYSLQTPDEGDEQFFNINANTGRVSFKEEPNYEKPQVVDETGLITLRTALSATDPASDYNAYISALESLKTALVQANSYQITVIVTDALGGEDTQRVNVRVIAINEAPSFTSATSTAFSEASGVGPVYQAVANDPDYDILIYSFANQNNDEQFFNIDENTGQISFKQEPDHENPFRVDNNYQVTIKATDSGNLTAEQVVSITVQDSDEAPIFIDSADMPIVDTVVLRFFKQFDASSKLLYTARAQDEDGDSIDYTLSGSDSSFFTIGENNGELGFKNDVEPSEDRVYNIVITAQSTQLGSETLTASIDVDVSIGAYTISSQLSITPASSEFLDISSFIEGFADISFSVTSLSFTVIPDGVTLKYNGAEVIAGDSITIATGDRIEIEVGPQVPVAELGLAYIATDATTGKNIATIITFNVNNDPVINPPLAGSISVAENTISDFEIYTLDVTETDSGQSLTYSLKNPGSGDEQFFDISATGVISFKAADGNVGEFIPDYETPMDQDGDMDQVGDNVYQVTVIVTDSAYGSAESQFDIEVTNVDLEFRPPASINIAETVAAATVLTTLEAIPEKPTVDSVTYAIKQTTSTTIDNPLYVGDGQLFRIDGNRLYFKDFIPDYENPFGQAANENLQEANVYTLTIVASYTPTGANEVTSEQVITIIIDDVAEQPVFNSANNVQFNKSASGVNASSVVYQAIASNTAMYDISVNDYFEIDDTSGELTFKDNVDIADIPLGGYTVTITAFSTDGAISSFLTVTIELTNNNLPQLSLTSGSAVMPADTEIAAGSTIMVDENTDSMVAILTASATDDEDDAQSQQLSYSLNTPGNGDEQYFSIDSTTGVLTFNSPLNYEAVADVSAENGAVPADNIYRLTIVVTDSDNGRTTQQVNIQLRDIDDPFTLAIIATVEGGNIVPPEQTSTDPAVKDIDIAELLAAFSDEDVIAANQAVIDTITFADLSPTALPDGVTLFYIAPDGTETAITDDAKTVTIVNGANRGHIRISVTHAADVGDITLQYSATDHETTTTVDGAMLTFALNHMPTLSLTSSADAQPASSEIAQGESVTVDENIAVIDDILTASAQDVDPAQSFTYSLETPENGDEQYFNINSQTGILTFNNTPNYEEPFRPGTDFLTLADEAARNQANTYRVTIIVEDNLGGQASQTVNVKVQDVNDVAVLSSTPTVASSISIAPAASEVIAIEKFLEAFEDEDTKDENKISSIAFAELPEGVTLRYTDASGNEAAADYVLDEPLAAGGSLRITIADTNAIGAIILTYSAMDAETKISGAMLVLAVNNLPVITTPTDEDINVVGIQVDLDENLATEVLQIIATDADTDAEPAQTLTYSLETPGEGDEQYFNIDSETGILAFNNTPNYEEPFRPGTDFLTLADEAARNQANTYQITIIVEDNLGGQAKQAIDVRVQDVNDIATLDAIVPIDSQVSIAAGSSGEIVIDRFLESFVDEDTVSINQIGSIVFPVLPAGFTLRYIDANGVEAVNNYLPGDLLAKGGKVRITVDSDTIAQKVTLDYTTIDGTQVGSILNVFGGSLTFDIITPAPTIDSSPLSSPIEVAENTPDDLELYKVQATAKGGLMPIYSLTGLDARFFEISDAGIISFKSAVEECINPSTPATQAYVADFENPMDANGDNTGDNTYEFRVVVNNGVGGKAPPYDIRIRITDVDLEFASIDSISIAENTPASHILLSLQAIAKEPNTAGVTYTIKETSGSTVANPQYVGDGQFFSIDSQGNLTFKTSPDFENPVDAGADNSYTLTVVAAYTPTGASEITSEQVITVTVDNVNEAPLLNLSSLDADATQPGIQIDFDERTTTNILTLSASDQDSAEAIRYRFEGAGNKTHEDLFDINTVTGEVRFRKTPNYENPFENTNNYSISVIAYNEVGGGDYLDSSPQLIEIRVMDVNEAPVFDEDEVLVYYDTATSPPDAQLYTAIAADEDGDALTYTLGGVAASEFTLTDGVLTFAGGTVPGSSGVYEIEITAVDSRDGSLTDVIKVTVNIGTGNNNPVITPLSDQDANRDGIQIDFDENSATTIPVVTISATDHEGQSLSYSVSGVDAQMFAISDLGVITFKNSPDFENPADTDADNNYQISFTVTDSIGGKTTEQLEIRVNNVNEKPIFADKPSKPDEISFIKDVDDVNMVLYSVLPASDEDRSDNVESYEIPPDSYFVLTNDNKLKFKNTQVPAAGEYRVAITAVSGTGQREQRENMDVIVKILSPVDVQLSIPFANNSGDATNGEIKFSEFLENIFVKPTKTITSITFLESYPNQNLDSVTLSYRPIGRSDDVSFNTENFDSSSTILLAQAGGLSADDKIKITLVSNGQDAEKKDFWLKYEINYADGSSDEAALSFDINNNPPIEAILGQGSVIADVIRDNDNNIEDVKVTVDSFSNLASSNIIAYQVAGSSEVRLYYENIHGEYVLIRDDDNRFGLDNGYVILKQNNQPVALSYDGFAADDKLFFDGDKAYYKLFVVAFNANTGDYDVSNIPSASKFDIRVNIAELAVQFISKGSVKIAENTAADTVVYQAAASDVSDSSFAADRYGFVGYHDGDRQYFNINEKTGEVTFKKIPDYENPTDTGADNIYQLNIVAGIGSDKYTVRKVFITVSDTEEAPLFSSADEVVIAQMQNNQNHYGLIKDSKVYNAKASYANAHISYSLEAQIDSGADMVFDSPDDTNVDLFVINPETGEVTIKDDSDFTESPNNEIKKYRLTIKATNNDVNPQLETSSALKEVTVTVSPVAVPILDKVQKSAVVNFIDGIDNADIDNADTVLYKTQASDADGDTVTYEIMPDVFNADIFVINPDNGELRFKSGMTPGYDDSATADNIKEVVIVAKSNSGTSEKKSYAAVIVKILQQQDNHGPVFEGATTGTTDFIVGQTEQNTVLYTLNAIDADGDKVTYSVGSAVSSPTGVIDTTSNLFQDIVNGELQFTDDTFNAINSAILTDEVAITITIDASSTSTLNDLAKTRNFTLTIVIKNPVDVVAVDNYGAVFSDDNSVVDIEDGNYDENTVLYTADAKDNDGDAIIYDITSATDVFEITPDTGELSFKSGNVPQYAAGAGNSYHVTVIASSTSGSNGLRSDQHSVTVNILPDEADYPPVFEGTRTDVISVVENVDTGEAIYTVFATVDQSYASAQSVKVNYKIVDPTNSDGQYFNIKQDTGEISFKSSPDYENPLTGNNEYSFAIVSYVTAEINGQQVRSANSNERQIDIEVIDAPIMGFENAISVFIDENTDVIHTLQATPGEAGETLSYSFANPNKGDARYFTISANGRISLKTSYSLDYENPLGFAAGQVNQDNRYELDALITNNLGELLGTQRVIVNVNDVDEAPLFEDGSTATATFYIGDATDSSIADTAAGDNTATVIYIANAYDPDRQPVTYSLATSVQGVQEKFAISADGKLTAKQQLLITESPYTVNITASVVGSLEDTALTVTVVVSDVNRPASNAPVFIGADNVAVDVYEKIAGGVSFYSVRAYKIGVPLADSESMSYSFEPTLSEDAHLFNIDATSGEISFKEAPDYETPFGNNAELAAIENARIALANADINNSIAYNNALASLQNELLATNSYQLSVTAIDVDDLSSTQTLNIKVLNQDEAPQFDNSITVSDFVLGKHDYNNKIVYDAQASDADGDIITYSLEGVDKSFFDIDGNDGEVKFASEPSARNYSFNVIASSIGADGVQKDAVSDTVTITVTTGSITSGLSSLVSYEAYDERVSSDNSDGEALLLIDAWLDGA